MTTLDVSTARYRVLVVENEPKTLDVITRRLARCGDDVETLPAMTQDEALSILDRRYVDAAIIDINLEPDGGDAGGYEVLRSMAERAPNAPTTIFTRYMDLVDLQTLITLVGTKRPDLMQILDKSYGADWIETWGRELVERWKARAVRIRNVELPLALLSKKQRAKRIPGIRLDENRTPFPEELAIEIDRLCRALFGPVKRFADGSSVEVRLSPIRREGLSKAITVEAGVRIGLDDGGPQIPGSRCVLKLGPVEDIRSEEERYHHFVKHGVRLSQRVELLGFATDQALGAICYSFAGGVFGDSLSTFDQLLREPELHALARETVEKLFSLSTKNWYDVDWNPRVDAQTYMRNGYDAKIDDSYREILPGSLKRTVNRLGSQRASFEMAQQTTDGMFKFEATKLTIPAANMMGLGAFLTELPSCLVHGDAHGGNVMIELSPLTNGGAQPQEKLERVCLIDYGNAGPGPRSVDAVALEASVRLADAQAIEVEVTKGEERPLTDAEFVKAVRTVVSRLEVERTLLRECWADDGARPFEQLDGVSGEGRWAVIAADIAYRARCNFKTLDLDEYLAMALPCALRQLGYDVSGLARLRLLTWITALYERLGKH